MCGAASTTITPVAELLKFLRQREASSATNADMRRKRAEECAASEDEHERRWGHRNAAYEAMSRKRAENYGAWANAVEELVRIAGQNTFVESDTVAGKVGGE
jgi:hypothetical protein